MIPMPTDAEKQEFIDSTLPEIGDALINLPELEDLNGQQLRTLAKSVAFDSLKEQLKTEVRKMKMDTGSLVYRWLNTFESPDTKRTFKVNIEVFLEWLEKKKTILDVNAAIADDYRGFLNKTKTAEGKKISTATIRMRIAACSSFWKYLMRHENVTVNPFRGVSLPKRQIEVKKAEQIPSDAELDKYEHYCLESLHAVAGRGAANKAKAARKALAALKVLRATGLRVGALPTLEIDRNGTYTARTKGGTASGQLSMELLSTLKSLTMNPQKPFQHYTAFGKWFQRIGKKLGMDFSVHSIRHRFAVNFYKEHRDPLKLRNALGHSSLYATEAYLSSLRTELE